MKFAGVILAAVAIAGACPARADGVDQRKPYGRVGIAVLDSSGVEQPMESSEAGADRKDLTIVAHVEANTACVVVVAAFDAKDGTVLPDWPPQVADLGVWDEKVMPKIPVPSKAAAHAAVEFQVLFLAPNVPMTAEIKKLVSVMQKSDDNRTLARLQANKLREFISGTLADSDRTHFLATRARSQIGGVIRGGNANWRKFASEVNFSDDRPGLLIFPSGKAQ